MSSDSKPTIVAFAGAWHPASALEPFIQDLQAQGYPAEAHKLKITGDATALKEDDGELMRSVLLSHIEKGKDVVFIAHSMAGLGGSLAIKGLHKKERASQGLTGGLAGIIYIAAFIPSGAMDGLTPDPRVIPDPETGLASITDAVNFFYNECPTDVAEATEKTLQGLSLQALISPTAKGYLDDAHLDGCRGYIACKKDNAVPFRLQKGMVETSGLRWSVKEMDTDHSPFLSQRPRLVELVVELIAEFDQA